MHNDGDTIIELKDAAIIKHNVVAIAKMSQPQTLQTPEVPYVHFVLRDAQPLLVPYETEEERDAEYNRVLEILKPSIN